MNLYLLGVAFINTQCKMIEDTSCSLFLYLRQGWEICFRLLVVSNLNHPVRYWFSMRVYVCKSTCIDLFEKKEKEKAVSILHFPFISVKLKRIIVSFTWFSTMCCQEVGEVIQNVWWGRVGEEPYHLMDWDLVSFTRGSFVVVEWAFGKLTLLARGGKIQHATSVLVWAWFTGWLWGWIFMKVAIVWA